MVYDQLAGPAGMQVQLDGVSAEPNRGSECCERILELDSRGTPVRDDLDKSPDL